MRRCARHTYLHSDRYILKKKKRKEKKKKKKKEEKEETGVLRKQNENIICVYNETGSEENARADVKAM